MATTRNSAFKSQPPRLPHKGPSRFLDKLDPWFVEFAHVYKEYAARGAHGPRRIGRVGDVDGGRYPKPVQSPPTPLHPEWPRTIEEMLGLMAKCGDSRFAKAITAVEQKLPREAVTTDLHQVLPNGISLVKYQVTVPELQWRAMRGDKNAGRRMVEIADLYNRWMHEQLPRRGVRCKTNLDHNLLVLFGLADGLGRLTSQELADFFDQFCPCGETHTSEVLRRLCRKLLKVMERGSEAAGMIAAASS